MHAIRLRKGIHAGRELSRDLLRSRARSFARVSAPLQPADMESGCDELTHRYTTIRTQLFEENGTSDLLPNVEQHRVVSPPSTSAFCVRSIALETKRHTSLLVSSIYRHATSNKCTARKVHQGALDGSTLHSLFPPSLVDWLNTDGLVVSSCEKVSAPVQPRESTRSTTTRKPTLRSTKTRRGMCL